MKKIKAIRPAHTYSIVAVDRKAGEIGVAVQSHWFSVGSAVPWAEAGVGAVATQSFTNLSFGPRGLELLRQGRSPQEVMEELLQGDPASEMRQLAVIDRQGRAAAYTGKRCIPHAGHTVGSNFSVQANLMVSAEVWTAMARSFKRSAGPLAERLVAVLEAGQTCGGDLRGKQSAAILVVRAEPVGQIWKDRLIDLRIEDHEHPVEELARCLRIFRAYEHMNHGDQALEEEDRERALREYGEARRLYPGSEEIRFWSAVSMANAGKLRVALPVFTELFSARPNWRTLLERIYDLELLKVDQRGYDRILAAARKGVEE
ncbi:MAG: DUF1028 domain-containing protein [Spirochaetaceae bacterium]|nr:MAG: DUF1028 domain-containing protein [Spirochaetaceae bacterium]